MPTVGRLRVRFPQVGAREGLPYSRLRLTRCRLIVRRLAPRFFLVRTWSSAGRFVPFTEQGAVDLVQEVQPIDKRHLVSFT